ncbi:MAG: threonine synthase [Thermaerobacterales bacterium]
MAAVMMVRLGKGFRWRPGNLVCMRSSKYFTHLECPRCGSEYPNDRLINLCRECSAPLLARYDLSRLGTDLGAADFTGHGSLWTFGPMLPIQGPGEVTLGEGDTPMYPVPRLGAALGLTDLWLKDEGLNPTGSFKARGAAVGIAMAKALGVETVALPTAGNAGGAWAAYAARAGLKAVVAMPADAPELTIRECLAYGARVQLVDGLISDAGAWIHERAEGEGWFEVATLKEPYRIEGKKTMGLEIARSLAWSWPDVILYPTGGGVGLIGIWKAMLELEELGWVRGKRPRLVAVQAEGCMPIVSAWESGRDDSDFWQGAETLAAGIRVPKALGDFLVLQALRDTQGTALAVTDEQILDSLNEVGRHEGIAICPEGAACVAALSQLRESDWLDADEQVLILNTGTGLKYPHLLPPVYAAGS